MYEYSIGQLAKFADTKVQTIRYYEQKQLLKEPIRTEGGQRRYNKSALERLKFIRHGREMGFSLVDIKELIDLSQDKNQACDMVDGIAKRHLLKVRSRIERLKSLENELNRMLDGCSHGSVEQCRIIEVLENHDHCQNHDHGETESFG